MSNCWRRASLPCAFLLCLLVGAPAFAQTPTGPAQDIEALKDLMQKIITENQELKTRVRNLEEAINKQERVVKPAAEPAGKEPTMKAAKEPKQDLATLEQRVTTLETEKTAGEDAVRSIVRQALSTLGSNINEYVTFGGTIEMLAGWREDFSAPAAGVLNLNSADLDFEIKVNDWSKGNLQLQYNPGTDVTFPTTNGFSSGVDRVTVDLAYITLGDPQKFPPYLTAGRIVVPLGISTGSPLGDVLNITNPTTLEVFETKRTAVGLNFALPTPALTPPPPPVFAPTVQPQIFSPLVSAVMRGLGYSPLPARLLPRKPTPVNPAPPLIDAGVYTYDGPTSSAWTPGNHLVGTANFQTKGGCGRPYDQLGADGRWWETFCPWSVNLGVNYTTSVFDSQFLSNGYQSVLGQIGYVPGMAGYMKSAFGPISLIAEWNGAVRTARFVDDQGQFMKIQPQAWQVTLGYQFDWNPWVQSIGDQGTYLAVGYSESYGLAGFVDANGARVGTVSRRRIQATLGEWVLEGLRLALEYSYNVDYPKSQGGTGKAANGFVSTLTLNW
jgi:hypothetical protein